MLWVTTSPVDCTIQFMDGSCQQIWYFVWFWKSFHNIMFFMLESIYYRAEQEMLCAMAIQGWKKAGFFGKNSGLMGFLKNPGFFIKNPEFFGFYWVFYDLS